MTESVTPAQRREAWSVFLLLLPCYALLPRPGPARWAGFAGIAAVCGYILFFSPHRRQDPASRRSLLEAPAVFGITLVGLWGALPHPGLGRSVGAGILAAVVAYILLVSARVHGDAPGDWGVASPRENAAKLLGPEGRRLRWAWVALNLALAALCFFLPELPLAVLRRALRFVTGLRIEPVLAPALLAVSAVAALNLLGALLRLDNLGRAARIVGAYLAALCAVALLGGYYYIYVVGGGRVELQVLHGLAGLGAYFFWGTLQELLFLSYFNTRIRKGLDSAPLSALLTAVIFSLHHLPAYTLTVLCFLLGIVWARIFQAAPNLLVLGLGHGATGGLWSLFKIMDMTPIKIKMSVGPFG